jgi:hypothetical protein
MGIAFPLHRIDAIKPLAICEDLRTIEATNRFMFSKQSIGVDCAIKSGKVQMMLARSKPAFHVPLNIAHPLLGSRFQGGLCCLSSYEPTAGQVFLSNDGGSGSSVYCRCLSRIGIGIYRHCFPMVHIVSNNVSLMTLTCRGIRISFYSNQANQTRQKVFHKFRRTCIQTNGRNKTFVAPVQTLNFPPRS